MDSIIDSMDVSLSTLREIVKDREAWGATVHGIEKSWTQLLMNYLLVAEGRGGGPWALGANSIHSKCLGI